MGGVDGKAGAWAYPEGGMGAVSAAIACSAAKLGVEIFTGSRVQSIQYEDDTKDSRSGGGSENTKKSTGVLLQNGTFIEAKKAVFSNATPEVTFNQLTPKGVLGEEFMAAVNRIDYTSPVTKLNGSLYKI